MNRRTVCFALAFVLSCLGCTDKQPPALPPAQGAASAAAIAGSAASAVVAAAPANNEDVVAPIAIDYYDERDALRLMPPVAFKRFKTEAGTLYCAVGLCEPDPTAKDPDASFVLSHHKVRLLPKREALSVGATSDPSADPTYLIEGRQIAGEDMYVPADGCLYVRQSADAFFPVTKRYCIGADGKLERQPQSEGIFPLAHKANFREPVQVFESPESKRAVDVVPLNESVTVMAARVDKLDDFQDSFSWLQVRTKRGIVGWVPMPESFDQCDDATGNQKKVCFLGD